MRFAKPENIHFICCIVMKITKQHLFTSAVTPLKGRLLIAEPFLNEQYFQRAVVLLVQHNQEESMGLVLNHQTEVTTTDVLDNFQFSTRIYRGGPVEVNQLFFLHHFSNINGAEQITAHLYFGGDWLQLLKAIRQEKHPERRVRFFSGYAGWGPEQLIEEIEERAWVCIADFDDRTLFSRPSDTLWHDSLISQGPKLAPFAHFPLNIIDN